MYRNFHTYFWSDPKIKKWPALARYHFAYLFTNEHTHLSGIYRLKIYYMQEDLGLNKKAILDNLKLFEREGVAFYDHDREVIWVVKMLFHQTHGNPGPKHIKAISSHLSSLHNTALIEPFLLKYKDLAIPYRYPIDRDSEGMKYPPISDPISVSVSTKEEDSKGETKKAEKIHIDKLNLTEPMIRYAKKNGINGHVYDVFARMVRNVNKKGERLTRTIRQWEMQFETFVDNVPKYNPEFIDAQPALMCSVCGVNPPTKNNKCHLCIRKELH